MKKEINKVPFSRERFEAALKYDYETIKSVAKVVGPSETTIRKALKSGEINEEYLDPICRYLGFDAGYFKGEAETEPIYEALITLMNYRERIAEFSSYQLAVGGYVDD